MTRFLRHIIVNAAFIACGLFMLAGTASAETPFPTIHLPYDKSQKCVHPTDEMRRNHMKYILHERDETMHEGVRGEKDSLANCIDCHVQPDENGQIAGIESDKHFCHGCHEYASVQIDCFQCHADRPQKYINRDQQQASSFKQKLEQMLTNTATQEQAADSADTAVEITADANEEVNQ